MSLLLKDFPKIFIIVLNWNGKQDTLDCLDSLTKLSYPNYEILIVDNGSTDNSVSCIRANFPHVAILETGANLGFAEGNNIGLCQGLNSGADLFLLLNNDTIVSTDLLEHFVQLYQLEPKAGIFGAKILLFDQRDTLDHLGGMWNSKTGTFTLVGLHQKEQEKPDLEPLEIDYVCGAGLMIKRSVIENIGYLESRFFLIWEESDFCFRARRAGFKILTCPQAKIWHKVSASFVGGKPHSTYFWWRNRLLWIERNCSLREKIFLIFCILIPDILHLIKIRLLKKTQLFFISWLNPHTDLTEKKHKLLKNRAALCGVRDYLLRKFGNGPSWLYKSK